MNTPNKQPEFFLDRSLGRGVADDLRALGWVIHRIVDHFPDDAQSIDDPEWILYGIERGWSLLCKDGRIKGRDHEREPIKRHGGVLFYLNNQALGRQAMVERFEAAKRSIERRATRGEAAIYSVGAKGAVTKVWP